MPIGIFYGIKSTFGDGTFIGPAMMPAEQWCESVKLLAARAQSQSRYPGAKLPAIVIPPPSGLTPFAPNF